MFRNTFQSGFLSILYSIGYTHTRASPIVWKFSTDVICVPPIFPICHGEWFCCLHVDANIVACRKKWVFLIMGECSFHFHNTQILGWSLWCDLRIQVSEGFHDVILIDWMHFPKTDINQYTVSASWWEWVLLHHAYLFGECVSRPIRF